MSYKKFIILSISIACIPLVLLAILLYLYDPYMLFHKPYFREVRFLKEMRVEDKSIIRDYDFNSYILGTSMLENTSAKEADKIIGGKWANISISGSTLKERAVILDYIFKLRNPINIIYSIDGYRLIDTDPIIYFNFDKVYKNYFFNLLAFYFKPNYIKCALEWSNNKQCIGTTNDLEGLTYWITDPSNKARFGGFDNWIKNKNHPEIYNDLQKLLKYNNNWQPHDERVNIEANKKYIKENLLDIMSKHKETNFHLIFPTYSRLYYKLSGYDKFAKITAALKWLVIQCDKLPNVKVYGFDDTSYANDIAHYKDISHYNTDMNSMQLKAIASNKHILTKDNIDSYLKTMEQNITNYDLTPLINALNKG